MSATKTAYKNLVGGEWVDSASGETMEVINPATGETIADVPKCSADDVDGAVAAAKKALPEWLDATPKDGTAFERRKIYDTTQPGRGNMGHTFGDDLTDELGGRGHWCEW